MFDVLNRIEELRKARNLSVYKLAQLSEIPQSTIATWYQKGHIPPVDKIERLCNAFDISISQFFTLGNTMALSENQAALINKWDLLSEREKLSVLSVIDALIDKSS